MEAAHVSVAAVSSTVMAGAYGMLPVIGGVMTMAMACVMVMLMLLTGTQAAVTIRLRARGQSLGKLSEFLTVLPPLAFSKPCSSDFASFPGRAVGVLPN